MIWELDLQFFGEDGPGGEKTEEPTSKKLDEARKEGQVAKSQEICNAVSLIAMFLTLRFAGLGIGERFLENFKYVYSVIPDYTKLIRGEIVLNDYAGLLRIMIIRLLLIILPIFAIGVIVAFGTNMAQIKWMVTTKPLQPKLNKLSPMSGVKR